MNIHAVAFFNILAIITIAVAASLVIYATGMPDGWGSALTLTVVGYATAFIGRLGFRKP